MTVLPGRPARLRRTAVALCTVLTLGTSVSCSVLGSEEPELPAVPLERPAGARAEQQDHPALAGYYRQEVEWSKCRQAMQCAQMEVPLDYADPGGEAIRLSLLRVRATDGDQRLGSLVLNPGGPGASGVEFAAQAGQYFGKELRAAFDLVGFDPRGVGQSTPIDCLSDAQLDTTVASDPDPDTPREVRRSLALIERFGLGCLERSGDLTRHVSTEEAARDMDILRSVLEEERLSYFGASYGTFLGATFADLFPNRVGRMVLDGAVDPALGPVETSLVQAEGFEVALRAYVASCIEGDECFLGSSVEEGLGRIKSFLEEADADPVRADGDRELTEGLAVLGIWSQLYNRNSWPALDVALSQALAGDGTTLLLFADQYVGRGPEGYVDNSVEALYAVRCLDHDDALSVEEAKTLEDRFLEASPVFGRMFAFGLTACGSWPVHSDNQRKPLTARGASPIMVIGTSRDPATPLAWAESLADQLDSGILVSRDGDGHTGYRSGNDCVDDTVERYLVAGQVPDDDVEC